MSTELYRKYLNIIEENSQPKIQLDEGLIDKVKPYVAKFTKLLMHELDAKTIQGLRQAKEQSGGDVKKFMSLLGITPQDFIPLVKDKLSEGIDDEKFDKMMGNIVQGARKEIQKREKFDIQRKQGQGKPTLFGTGTSLKSKVLSGIFNIWPLIFWGDLFSGLNIMYGLHNAGHHVLEYVFLIVGFLLTMGIGQFDFGDMDDPRKKDKM